MADQATVGIPAAAGPTPDTNSFIPNSEYRWSAGFLLIALILGLIWALITIWPSDMRPVPTLQQQQKVLEAHSAIEANQKAILVLDSKSPGFQKAFDDLNAKIEASNKALAEEHLKAGQAMLSGNRTGCLLGYCPGPEGSFLLLAAVAGALGSAIHAATALSVRIGTNHFDTRWTVWYVLRMPIGAALAVLFFCIVRAGFLNQEAVTRTGTTIINPFGVTAVSALAGMFSRTIMVKLAAVVDTLFSAKASAPASKPAPPKLVSIAPKDGIAKAAQDGKDLTLTLVFDRDIKEPVEAKFGDDPAAPVTVQGKTVTVVLPKSISAANVGPNKLKLSGADFADGQEVEFKIKA